MTQKIHTITNQLEKFIRERDELLAQGDTVRAKKYIIPIRTLKTQLGHNLTRHRPVSDKSKRKIDTIIQSYKDKLALAERAKRLLLDGEDDVNHCDRESVVSEITIPISASGTQTDIEIDVD